MMKENTIKIFSKLNIVSESAIGDSICKDKDIVSKNLKFIPRLNANSFAYQQLIIQLLFNIKSLFGIDIQDYITGIYDKDKEPEPGIDDNYILYLQYNDTKFNNGFCYVEDISIDFDTYIKDVLSQIFYLGKKIRILREDMRIMTLRNSYSM